MRIRASEEKNQGGRLRRNGTESHELRGKARRTKRKTEQKKKQMAIANCQCSSINMNDAVE